MRVAVACLLLVALATSGASAQRRRPRPGALPEVPRARPAQLERTGTAADWARGIGWPSSLPAPRVEAISGTTSVLTSRHRFPDGAVEIRARGSGTIADVWPEWVARIRRGGGVVQHEHVTPAGASALVCATAACGRGERFFASMTMDSWLWLTLRGAASGAARSAPGACVPIPSDEWRICWTASDGRMGCSMGFETRWDVDLDRDGIPDARVPQPRARSPEGTCPHEVEWDLYLSRGTCGHAVGRIRGGIALWNAVGGEVANGWAVVQADEEAAGPWDSEITRRYEYRGGAYVAVAETVHESRCDVHPADCEEINRQVCALRGHPTIPGPFDHERVSPLLLEASQRAQAQCSAGITRPVRCAVDMTIAPSGTPAMRISGCPARVAACVRPHFAPLTFPPFSGEPHPIGINFQLPAP